MKTSCILVCAYLILLINNLNSQSSNFNDQLNNDDALDYMLAKSGITKANLGFAPKGYWQRYPYSSDIPYRIVSFDDLMAEPDKIYDFNRVMAHAVEEFFNPNYLGTDGLLKVAYFTGIQHLTTQFRSYNASLFADSSGVDLDLAALKRLYHTFGREFIFHRFGERADFPRIEYEYRKSLEKLDPELRKILAFAIHQLIDAWRFREIGMRNVDYKNAVRVTRIRLLGETQFDGMEFYPEIEDCAKSIDMNSIYYAGYKLLQTSMELKKRLMESSDKIDLKSQNLDIQTPMGRIILDGDGDDIHDYSDALLLIDLNGNDTYKGSAGSTSGLEQGISLLIDLNGNDIYSNDEEFVNSQGSAIFGAALILDCSGNDKYSSKRLSQGSAMFGIGILADLEGDDKYELWTSGQGGAYFGVGILMDRTGNDIYSIWGDGQGYGGVGGAGSLIDYSGDDIYKAEINSSKVFRPDYHSKGGIHNYTYCQGSGVGRRGDITDGHSWAGGIGILIDVNGNDKYFSGNWSQACGYWYGMGFLYDKNGNDYYESTTWSMACGAHFAISGFFDESGDDIHKIWYDQGVGMGFGHDFTVSVFMDKSGNDQYELKENGLGYAINKSQVFFYELGGDDQYITGSKGNNYGWNNIDRENPPTSFSSFHLYCDQIAFFGDLEGNDTYKIIDIDTGNSSDDKRITDGLSIFYPEQKDKLASKRYFGMGIDFNTPKPLLIEMFRDKLK